MTEATAPAPHRPGSRMRVVGWSLAAALLLLPAVAMQFTDEVQWTAFDFVAMGMLLAALGLGLELAMRISRNRAFRVGATVVLVAAFLLVWAELAVGLFGD